MILALLNDIRKFNKPHNQTESSEDSTLNLEKKKFKNLLVEEPKKIKPYSLEPLDGTESPYMFDIPQGIPMGYHIPMGQKETIMEAKEEKIDLRQFSKNISDDLDRANNMDFENNINDKKIIVKKRERSGSV